MTPPDAYLTRVLGILNAPITMEAIREYPVILERRFSVSSHP